jgi:transcriptional regulator with XRE-family HTH domain
MMHQPANLESIGARVRRVRLAKGIGLRELALKIHTSTAVIWALETGKRSTNMFTLIDVAKALGVSIDYLAYGSNYGVFNK